MRGREGRMRGEALSGGAGTACAKELRCETVWYSILCSAFVWKSSRSDWVLEMKLEQARSARSWRNLMPGLEHGCHFIGNRRCLVLSRNKTQWDLHLTMIPLGRYYYLLFTCQQNQLPGGTYTWPAQCHTVNDGTRLDSVSCVNPVSLHPHLRSEWLLWDSPCPSHLTQKPKRIRFRTAQILPLEPLKRWFKKNLVPPFLKRMTFYSYYVSLRKAKPKCYTGYSLAFPENILTVSWTRGKKTQRFCKSSW